MTNSKTIRRYLVDGFSTPNAPKDAGPYELVAVLQHSEELVVATGHNPVEVRSAHSKISRNDKLVTSIELRDTESCLETLWKPGWDFDFGYQKPTSATSGPAL